MSSPASMEWSVIENERIQNLARQQAMEEASIYEKKIQDLLQKINNAKLKFKDEISIKVSPVPRALQTQNYLKKIEAYISELKNWCNVNEKLLIEAIASVETGRLFSEMSKDLDYDTKSMKKLFKTPSISNSENNDRYITKETTEPNKVQKSEIIRILNHLSGVVPDSERTALTNEGKDILQITNPARSNALTYSLRAKVQKANEEAEKRLIDAEKATQLIKKLRGLKSTELPAIILELEKIEHQKQTLTNDLIQRTTEVEKKARLEMDQKYAADVIQEELKHLGYEVQAGFSTILTKGSETILNNPSINGYQVIMSATNDQKIDVELVRSPLNVTRSTGDQKQRDYEVQETWCQNLAQVCSALGKQDIKIRVPKHSKPGQQAVPDAGSFNSTQKYHRKLRNIKTLGGA